MSPNSEPGSRGHKKPVPPLSSWFHTPQERGEWSEQKGDTMGRGGIIWTIVGILLIIALIIYIF